MDLTARDLCSVLDDDDCNASEKEIFDVAIAWLKHKSMRITSCCREVLAVVRFQLMSHDDLQTCAEELASSDIPADCYSTFLEEARTYHCDDAIISSRRTRMRNSVDVVIALGGFTASEQTTNRFQVLPTAELLAPSSKDIRLVFRSTLRRSRPNKSGLKCPSMNPSICTCPSVHKSFFNFNEIWRVGRG